MPGSHDDLKDEIQQLTSDVRSLAQRVEKLERGARNAQGVQAPPVQEASVQPVALSEKESPWSVGGVAALMSRGATTSLILLVALVLRTLTDSGAVNMSIGTVLGIGYATLLAGTGWLMYRGKHPFASMFSISGVLLLVAVILETHASFGSISTLPAYGFLAVAAGGMAIISHQYRVAVPVNVGTMAVLMVAVPLGLPDINFPALAVFLLAVNVMAFTAVRLPRTGWLRIVTFIFTVSVVFLWGLKLRVAFKAGENSMPAAVESVTSNAIWFYTVIAVYFMFYVGASLLAICKGSTEEIRPFDHILPTAAAAWAYLTCLMVVLASGTGQLVLGVVGVVLATCLLGLAALKGKRSGAQSRGTTTFAFPAALLLALSFRDVSGESVVALAILSWAAFSLAWLSTRWLSAGVRVTSYILQVTVLGASFLLLLMAPAGNLPVVTVASMAVITLVSFFHYRLIRRTLPPEQSIYFTRFDRKDAGGVAPLLVSVGTAFLALRAVLYIFLAGQGADIQAGVTIIINTGALVLFLSAMFRRNAEIKWVGVLVTMLGGGKVFFYDLFRMKGVPVVLGVLSFGLATAIGSWVLGKWQHQDKRAVVDQDVGR